MNSSNKYKCSMRDIFFGQQPDFFEHIKLEKPPEAKTEAKKDGSAATPVFTIR